MNDITTTILKSINSVIAGKEAVVEKVLMAIVAGGRVLLETHCLDWPSELGSEGAYGKIIRVELLHKLHDELKYDSLEALTQGIAKDCDDARAFFATYTETRRQTTRDRI